MDVYDGSEDLVLSVAYGVGFTGSQGLAENGEAFLYVTGNGRAWFSDTSAGWGAARELLLSPEEAARVAASVGYGLWPRRYGDHSTTDVVDAWVTHYLDRAGHVRCYPQCSFFRDDEVLRTMDLFAAIETASGLGAEPVGRHDHRVGGGRYQRYCGGR